jgi:hypothetical protein
LHIFRGAQEAAKAVVNCSVADPELLVTNNVLRNEFKSREDPKYVKILLATRSMLERSRSV